MTLSSLPPPPSTLPVRPAPPGAPARVRLSLAELGAFQSAALSALEAELLHLDALPAPQPGARIEAATRLYVAAVRLAEAVEDRGVVLATIRELLADVLGSEEVAIFELDGARGVLLQVHGVGEAPAALDEVPLGHGRIGQVALTGAPFVAEGPVAPGEPCACVPLEVEGDVLGAVAVFGLLPQKEGLEPGDLQLLELIRRQGACALVRAYLVARGDA
jgi:hypothetical protein